MQQTSATSTGSDPQTITLTSEPNIEPPIEEPDQAVTTTPTPSQQPEQTLEDPRSNHLPLQQETNSNQQLVKDRKNSDDDEI
jgi:hypothetical protein